MRTKLHEAILMKLEDQDGILVSDLVKSLNETGLYLKKDLSPLTNNQIYGRVHQYPELFYIQNRKIFKKVQI